MDEKFKDTLPITAKLFEAFDEVDGTRSEAIEKHAGEWRPLVQAELSNHGHKINSLGRVITDLESEIVKLKAEVKALRDQLAK